MENRSNRHSHPNNSTSKGQLLAVLVLTLFAFCWVTPTLASEDPTTTLVLVNGEAITSTDLDQMIMKAHRSFDLQAEGSGLVQRLLNKRINDLLIVQDAFAAGMDEEPQLLALVADKRQDYAIRAYVDDHLQLPTEAPVDSVQAYFNRYYWQIQVRRISVRTHQEAMDLKLSVMAGADMDSLARELSLDTKKLKGGLYNLIYWADLENRIREEVLDLEVGQYSDVFPYNDAFSFVRLEQRLPVDWDSFEAIEPKISPKVLGLTKKQFWDDFVDELIAAVEIEENMAGMFAIIADSAQVLTGDFLREDPARVIQVVGGDAVTGTELRKAISHEVMQNALAPFSENLNIARRKATTDLILATSAKNGGYLASPEIEAKVEQDLEQALIELYLNDTVASKIRFNREEFAEFYEENQEKFRGPEEVSLDILILDKKADAEDAAARLAEGADFGFIFAEYNPGQEATLGKSSFIKRDQLSQAFRDQLVNMEAGDSSQAIEMPMGWMVFKLVRIREGALEPMEAVEVEIRKVIYQRKFNTLLDKHLTLLKEYSEIQMFDDRIKAYILSGEK